ncbi:MAG: hypothetical protein QM608_06225 [Caulobacter sp.]
MHEDGYTLAEALAAIVMIGLAIGGLAQAVHVIGRLQVGAAAGVQAQARLGRLQQALDRQMVQVGPAWSDAGPAEGSAGAASLPCGGEAVCGLALESGADGGVLSMVDARGVRRSVAFAAAKPALRFVDATGVHDAWPPAAPTPRRPLLAVAVIDAGRGGRPLAVGRIWSRQPGACQFDGVSGQCRNAS